MILIWTLVRGGEGTTGERGAEVDVEESMENGSMDFDYCQGNSTITLSFERETGKWSGFRSLARNSEFGETAWRRVVRGTSRLSPDFRRITRALQC
jgi:hypothetical protein